jgi:DNA-binding NtrC family response regulator
MKRILVIDESEVVRETLALVLGREFTVLKRPPSSPELSFVESHEDIDLLILGVAPAWIAQPASLMRYAAQSPFAVLFLVDTRMMARAFAERDQVACLAKPFNPYELQEKVGQLLARQRAWKGTGDRGERTREAFYSRYLEYPFVSRNIAAAARRFAKSRLPLLITGEQGCGQGQLARALCLANGDAGPRFIIDAPTVTASGLDAQAAELAAAASRTTGVKLVIQRLDRADPAAQSLLATFLEQKDEKFARIQLLATANADLLEQVYRGVFLEEVYYKLAMLTLRLLPLRDRREDIGPLADWFARFYADQLGLEGCFFSPGAISRLVEYLWFGNLNEMETVVARTLALQRKLNIEAADLVFDFGGDVQMTPESSGDFTEFLPDRRAAGVGAPTPHEGRNGASVAKPDDKGKLPELNIVIHEIAHELKNPMVTIKTFAQLLGDRYDDEHFRTRFQEVVGGDIERMNDLLEMMVEFADFSVPRRTVVALDERLKTVIDDIGGEYAKRQTRVRWVGNGRVCEIQADDSQLTYVLKNVLLAVLSQAKMGSEIEIDVAPNGSVRVSYLRESAKIASITHYLTVPSGASDEILLPLRLLLAKQLVERNGGRLSLDQSENDRETIKMEFPIGQYGKEI